MDTIKSGKKTLELKHGSTIMDNGSCRQLMREYPSLNIMISVKEFKAFKAMSCVSEIKEHNYGDNVSLWQYQNEF
jgi:hypothetical protein